MAAITSAGSGTWSSTVANTPWPSGTVPGAGDTVIIANGHTVTIDQAATLSVGADSATAAIAISSGGKLQYLSTATNSLTLNVKGDITVTGTLEFGTLSNPIPSNRTCTVQLNNSSALADGKYGLKTVFGGVVNLYGASKTLSTKLTADVAANATTFVVADVTGWAASDAIAIASTTRTPADSESVTVASISTLTVTILAGGGTGGNSMKNAHGGGGTTMNGVPITAEVINQTLNVKVTSASTTAAGFITVVSGSTFTAKYVEFSYLGVNAVNQHGLEFAAVGGAATFCSFHDSRNLGVYFATTTGSVTFSNNVLYNLNTVAAASTTGLTMVATTGTHTLDSNVFIGINVPSGGTCISLLDVGSTLTNNVFAGCGVGGGATSVAMGLSEIGGALGTFSGNTIHSCAGLGISFTVGGIYGNLGTTANPIVIWRNGASGITLLSACGKLSIALTAFGNTPQNILVSSAQFNTLVHDSTLNSDSSFATTSNINVTTGSKLFIENSNLGQTNACTQDILVSATVTADVTAIYCSTMTTTFTATALASTTVRQQNYGQVVGQVKSVHGVGTIAAQSATRHTASGIAWQCTPTSAARALVFPGPTIWDSFKVAVLANTQVTITAWVNVDGSYNGTTQPQLVLVGGILQGIAADVVATAAVSANTWQQLSVSGTPTESGCVQCYVQGFGTAGNFYVDDIVPSQG